MGGEVYADLYFLINMGMDLLSLRITASLLHRKTRVFRLLAAAALGGAYALAALLLSWNGVWGFLADCLAVFFMCVSAFWEKGLSFLRLLRSVLVNLLISMLLGGIMTGLSVLLNRLDLPIDALRDDSLPVWLFALLAAAAGVAAYRFARWFGLRKKTRTVTVRAVLFGRRVELRAMVDSGNLLRDPVSGKSVIVAEREKLRNVIPQQVFAAEENPGDASFLRWMSTYENASKLRVIPTRTAAGEALLFAVVPDRLTLAEEGGREYPADYLIAPSSLGGRAQEFDALIAPD